jgi:hypothetical protein
MEKTVVRNMQAMKKKNLLVKRAFPASAELQQTADGSI